MTKKQKKIRILFFSPYFYPYISGITTYPFELFTHLGNDYDVTVLTFKHDKQISSEEQIHNIHVVRMPYLCRVTKGFIAPQSPMYFYKYVRKTDVVILNMPNVEGLPLALLANWFKKPSIALFHCLVFLPVSFFNMLVSGVLFVSMYLQYALVDTIVGYTQDYVQHTWVGKWFGKKVNITFPPVPSLVPDTAFLKKLRAEKKGGYWVGFAGRIAREKGIEHIVEAVSRMKKRNVCLVFAGPYGKDVAGEEPYYHKIKMVLEEKEVNHIFLGSLNKKRLTAFYQTIDVLLLTSVNSTEAFGMVQVEAMLAGKPVIASNLPGVRVPVKKTGLGMIVEPGDVNALSEAIDRMRSSPPKATAKPVDVFSLKRVLDFWRRLIKGAVRV
ncbi:glycosyltransferase family 4 protein [Candidatus Woesebacteria bacterium]|nr:glycosyltransferase family 4 protein [Candidatus Woesebacteria bacterium]